MTALPRPATLAAVAAGAAFGAAAHLRRAKPIHPRGVVLSASVSFSGSTGDWGSPWLDRASETGGFVRLSRSVGLPSPLPDVLGFGLRLPTGSGTVGDLLLSTCLGRAPYARHLLASRLDPAATYSSVLTYRTARGPAMIAAWPSSDRRLPSAPADLARALAAEPMELGLYVAPPLGGWEQFGVVEVSEPMGTDLDPPVSFDPVRNAPPGLPLYPAAAHIRQRSYASARRHRPHGDGQHSAPRALATEPT